MRAALDLLAELGFARLSMEAVATRAGTGKATLYRRWPGKAELVAAALARFEGAPAVRPDTGSFREDLLVGLHELAGALSERHGALLAHLVAELRGHPELLAAARKALLRPWQAVAADAVARAVARGEVRRDAPWPVIHEIGPALLFRRMFVVGAPVDDDYLTMIVDRVVMPLVSS